MIKRCQSVEVLSNDRMIRKSVDNSSSSKPPPLPPKTERPLENILNSTLANDNIVVDDKAAQAAAMAELAGRVVEIVIRESRDRCYKTFFCRRKWLDG